MKFLKELFNLMKENFKTYHLIMILDGVLLGLHYITDKNLLLLFVSINLILAVFSDLIDPETIKRSDLFRAYGEGFMDGCKAMIRDRENYESNKNRINKGEKGDKF